MKVALAKHYKQAPCMYVYTMLLVSPKLVLHQVLMSCLLVAEEKLVAWTLKMTHICYDYDQEAHL